MGSASEPVGPAVKAISAAPNLVDQVVEALLDAVVSGRLAPGERIIQERLAQGLGVSRQPIQQALLLLRNQGILIDAPGRGLLVAPLDPVHVQKVYDMRAVLEGLAARRAAELQLPQARRLGTAAMEAGRKAVASGVVARMTAADIRFHQLIYELSGNGLVAAALAPHLTYTQRVMGEVLVNDERPRDIWDQHAAILAAILAGDADRAEQLARDHIKVAETYFVGRLKGAPGRHASS